RAGRPALTLVSSDLCEVSSGGRRAARSAFSSALMRSQLSETLPLVSTPFSTPRTCGRRRILFLVSASTTSQAANAFLYPADRLGHLIGFLDGVGGDAGKILLEVPGASRDRRAQRRHHLDQAKNVAGRFHVVSGWRIFPLMPHRARRSQRNVPERPGLPLDLH